VRHVRRALLIAVVLLVTACSDGGGEDAATTTTTEPSTAGSSSTTAPPTYTGDAASPFCTLLRDTDPRTILAGDGGDPAAVEQAFTRLVRVFADARALAPAEIAADVGLVADGIEALDAALAAVGYDFAVLAATPQAAEVTAAVNDPVFTDAGARISAYRTQVCGL
jgi:hypothetical protein